MNADDTPRRPTLAAVILTKDEALDIGGCIDSCRFADEVIVFDSLSTDGTPRIARERGATVLERPFTNYAEQRNAALDAAAHHTWVLMMDADERVPADLAAEIRGQVDSCDATVTMMLMRRRDFFLGRWLRRSTGYPTWAGRVMRTGHVRFVRDINERPETAGRKLYLRGHFDHFPFSKGVAAWVERHNRYSTMEARRLLAERCRPLALAIDPRDPQERRALAKQIFYRLPWRPTLTFLALYVLRGGFLDGAPGLAYCRLRSLYEYLIVLKMRELRSTAAADADGAATSGPPA